MSRVCDYGLDCMNGDDSDEKKCDAYPGRCDFEHGLCVWEQGRKDDFDWTRNTGYTPSYSTGPLTDHTTGQSSGELHYKMKMTLLLFFTCSLCEHYFGPITQPSFPELKTLFLFQGHYMYVETSWPRKAGDRARLITPVIKSESKGCRLRFYYHMRGDDIGSLLVYVRKSYNDLKSIQVVLNITGEQVWKGWLYVDIRADLTFASSRMTLNL